MKCLSAALLGVLLVGCGGHNNGGNTPAPANLRFVNASTDASLTAAVDGTAEVSNVPGASTSGYASGAAGTHTVTVTGGNGSLASPAVSVSLSSAQTYSLVAYVRDGAVVASLVAESQVVPASGNATLGVANLSPDSGGLDLYL